MHLKAAGSYRAMMRWEIEQHMGHPNIDCCFNYIGYCSGLVIDLSERRNVEIKVLSTPSRRMKLSVQHTGDHVRAPEVER